MLTWCCVGCSLFRVFGGDRIKGLMSVFQIEDLPIESKMLTDALTEAQRKVEAYFFGACCPIALYKSSASYMCSSSPRHEAVNLVVALSQGSCPAFSQTAPGSRV